MATWTNTSKNSANYTNEDENNSTYSNLGFADAQVDLWSTLTLPWQLDLPWLHIGGVEGRNWTNIAIS